MPVFGCDKRPFLMGVDTRKTTSFGYFCHTRNLTKKSLDKAREKIFLKFKPRMICNQLQI